MTKRPKSSDRDSTAISRRALLACMGGIAAPLGGQTAIQRGAAAGYETITVSGGDHTELSVGDGETFANTLIDVTAEGASAAIRATGSDWTIANVGVRGEQSPTGDGTDADLCDVTVSEDGSATIQNCYFGDGSERGQAAAVNVTHDHAGELTISNLYAAMWAHGGVNATTCGWRRNENWPKDPGKGTVHLDASFFENCNVGAVLLPSTGSTVTGTTILVDGHAPARPFPGGGEGKDMNGIWVRGDGFARDEIKDTHILVTDELSERSPAAITVGESPEYGPPPYGGDVTVADSELKRKWKNYRELGDGQITTERLGEDPKRAPGEGVPTSAETAASGTER